MIFSKLKAEFYLWTAKVYYCKIWGLHDWTAKIQQDPDMKIVGIDGLLDSARTYCLRCGKVSAFSVEFENEINSNKIKNEKRN